MASDTTSARPPRRPSPLTREVIVDAACVVIERDGLRGLSMRKLGRELSVDPMAIYHHVPNKSALLGLVTERIIGSVEGPGPETSWDEWIRRWALAYWDVAATYGEVILAGIADPAVGAGGMSSTSVLIAVIRRAGVPPDLLEPIAFLVVDAIHGSALAVANTPDGGTERTEARRLFQQGLDVVVDGIAARAASEKST